MESGTAYLQPLTHLLVFGTLIFKDIEINGRPLGLAVNDLRVDIYDDVHANGIG